MSCARSVQKQRTTARNTDWQPPGARKLFRTGGSRGRGCFRCMELLRSGSALLRGLCDIELIWSLRAGSIRGLWLQRQRGHISLAHRFPSEQRS
eukprot:scaffold20189_cov58-Phaeocystis_antarctica.AAC.6